MVLTNPPAGSGDKFTVVFTWIAMKPSSLVAIKMSSTGASVSKRTQIGLTSPSLSRTSNDLSLNMQSAIYAPSYCSNKMPALAAAPQPGPHAAIPMDRVLLPISVLNLSPTTSCRSLFQNEVRGRQPPCGLRHAGFAIVNLLSSIADIENRACRSGNTLTAAPYTLVEASFRQIRQQRSVAAIDKSVVIVVAVVSIPTPPRPSTARPPARR